MISSYKGCCYCGAVEFRTSGAPTVAGYSHSRDFQSWSAAPMTAFGLWTIDSIMVTKGESKIGTYNKTDNSFHKFCTDCGGHLMTNQPDTKLVYVYTAVLEGYEHHPQLHLNYGNKSVSVADGLPKYKDMPADFGGSGIMLPD